MVTFDSLRQSLGRRFSGSWERYSVWRRVFWAILFAALLAFLISRSLVADRVSLVVGEPSPYTVKAPKEFIDRAAWDALRSEAAAGIPEVHDQDSGVDRQVLIALERRFESLYEIQEGVQETEDPDDRAAAAEEIGDLFGIAGDSEIAMELVDLDMETTALIEDKVMTLVESAQIEGIKPDGLGTAGDRVRMAAGELDFHPLWREFAGQAAATALRPNLFYNAEKTEERRQDAMESVEPVIVARGMTLVRDGEMVTPDDIERLRDAGLLRDATDIQAMLGSAAVGLLMVLLLGAFLRQFRPRIYQNEAHIVLLGLLIVAVLASTHALWPVSGYLAPVAVATMLIAILLDPQVAVFAGVLMGVMVGFLSGEEIRFLLVAMVGGFTGALAVSGVDQRSDLMRAGFAVSAANAFTILILFVVWGRFSVSDWAMWRDVMVGGANGILCGILTIGSLPYMEGFFGLVTPVRLIELSNPNQPLLRELLVQAPGTYHHSIMVANLAEAAVEEVGGNSLLARVGAYYHDVGKIRRPYFYIENQMGGENPHSKLTPNLSALIITAHVKEGMELAARHSLPREIQRFIGEHHGTSRVGYFYSRAAEGSPAEGIMEENFRYEGPRPSSKESAVVMLADAAEAAVRSLTRANPDRIETMVRKIIKDRLFEGQLDRADLTFRDLDKIAEVFVRVMTGVFHARIEYPDGLSPEEAGNGKEVPGGGGRKGKGEQPSG